MRCCDMSRKIKFILFIAFIVLISACKPSASGSASSASPSDSVPPDASVDSQVNSIKNSILHPLESPTAQQVGNATRQAVNAADSASQKVLVPSRQLPSDTIITIGYVSPCLVQNWKVLNIYCKGKTFWHNQSTLLSWYVSYSLVLFALLIAIIIIWHMMRKGNN